MKTKRINFNADVGEGVNNESCLLPLLSSCNIACGGHAGTPKSMQEVVDLCKKHHVKIGAHPSYPDKENFGRVILKLTPQELFYSISNQIQELLNICQSNNIPLHHVKPHGALYNVLVTDRTTAEVMIQVMKLLPQPIFLYVPYKSVIATLAKKNKIPIVYEVFADRNYNSDYSLVSRSKPNALITDVEQMVKHILCLTKGKIKSIADTVLPIKAETFCIHGDTPKAEALLKAVQEKLKTEGILVA